MAKERTLEGMKKRMAEMNKGSRGNEEQKKMATLFFKNASKVGNKVFLEIPLELIKIDHKMYQRPLQAHVRTIAKNWDDDKCDPLMVNYRSDGFFYTIDGQHRTEAAIMRGIESLVCNVFVGLSIKEEADMFTEQNEGTKKLTPYDTYKANICRGEVVDTQIKEVCDKYGIKVVKQNAIKTLRSVTTARAVVRIHGKENLDWIFKLMEECGWDAYKKTYSDGFIASINNIKVANKDNLDLVREKLVGILKESTPNEMQALAHAKYPYMGRTTALHKLFEELVKEALETEKFIKDKVMEITKIGA